MERGPGVGAVCVIPVRKRKRNPQTGQRWRDTSSRVSSQCNKEDLELDLGISRLLTQKKREEMKGGGEREGAFLQYEDCSMLSLKEHLKRGRYI